MKNDENSRKHSFLTICERNIFLKPAKAFEKFVITFKSVFDALEKIIRVILCQLLRKYHLVEIFYSYPTEYCSEIKIEEFWITTSNMNA